MIRRPPRSTLFPTRRSSDLDEALSMSDRILVMHAGRILREGTPEEVYRRPRERFVAEFLDRKSTRLNSSHLGISYAVFCLKKKNEENSVVCRTGSDDVKRQL